MLINNHPSSVVSCLSSLCSSYWVLFCNILEVIPCKSKWPRFVWDKIFRCPWQALRSILSSAGLEGNVNILTNVQLILLVNTGYILHHTTPWSRIARLSFQPDSHIHSLNHSLSIRYRYIRKKLNCELLCKLNWRHYI